MIYIKLNIQRFADGKVVIETDLDSKGFKSGLDKMQSIAKTGFKTIATSVGVVSTALAGLVAKSVTMAGDLEQQIGGTEAVFGDFAETVQKKAGEAFNKMGLSANDFMATANKMGALMQGSGLSIEESMDLSTKAMQRAADVASIMGIDVNMAMESVAGAAKGNFTMMDNLGVAMNATTIEAYALSKGIDTAYTNMDNATKVGLAMEMFLEKTAYATGNYAKENKTFAGSFNTLKAATKNFLSGAGGIKDVADALVDFSGILVESIANMAPSVVEGITQLTKELIPMIPEIMKKLFPVILEGAISIIEGLVAIFPALINMIQQNTPTIIEGAILIVKTLVMSILDMLPEILQLGIDLIVELAKGIAESADELIPKIVETIIELFMVLTAPENLEKIIEAGIELVVALIKGIVMSLPKLFENGEALLKGLATILSGGTTLMREIGWALLKALIKGLGEMLSPLLEKAGNLLKSLIQKFKEGIAGIKEVGKQLISGLWSGIQEKWNSLKDKVESFGQGIVKKFKSVFGIKSPSRVFRDEIGKQLSAGIGVGFEDELSNVYNDMQKAIDLETSKMSANVQTSGTYQMAMTGTPTFNLLDNSSNQTQLVVNGKVLAEVVNTENRNREVATA